MRRLSIFQMFLLKIFWTRYYTPEYEPVRCIHCNSTEQEDDVTDSSEGYTHEKYILCANCHNPLGFWAYGYFEPQQKPTWKNIFLMQS